MLESTSRTPDTSEQSAKAATLMLKATKKEVRTLMKAKLSQIPRSTLESQSKVAFQALLGLRQYRDAKKISIYLSMPAGEIQTDEIVRHALDAGKEVFVPYLHRNVQTGTPSIEGGSGVPKKVMDMVRLRDLEDYQGLERDAWGIPTVTEEGVEGRERILGGTGDGGRESRAVSLDLMLLPGIAFEVEDGKRQMVSRLGHGRGFYDYFLHRYRSLDMHESKKVAVVKMALFGLALKEQFLRDGQESHVPMGPHDSLIDGLVLGDGHVIESAPS